MRLAIFGGTFDPVHMGHLLVAEAAREQFHLDRVLFLPTAVPPHKKTPTVSAAQRLAMVRLAIRGNSAFQVTDWEIRQQRKVFTFETLAHFKALYSKAALFFIFGSDSLRDIPTWRHGAKLLGQCRFLTVERKEAPWALIPRSLRRRVSLVRSPLYDVASHAIRACVLRGASIRYQVPESVAAYIRTRRLYKRPRH